MSLELKGKLIAKLPPVSGEGKNGKWEKREFVIETDDQYPKKICISAWNDKVAAIDKIAEGDIVNAFVNIESREYNSRWYTDIRAWRIDRDVEVGTSSSPPPEHIPEIDSPEDDLPF